MRLRFVNASCVAAGTFNIYIFQPHWVGLIEGCPEGTPIEVKADLSQPGFQLTAEPFACDWTMRPDKIVLGSEDQNCHCGAVMARVLGRLPETPLRAIGNNYRLHATKADLDATEVVRFFPLQQQQLSVGELERQARVMIVKQDDTVYNLALLESVDAVELSMNVHTEVDNSGRAIEIANAFQSQQQTAYQLIKEIWGIELV